MASFECTVCGKEFTLSEEVLNRYPGWTPKYCREHSPKKKSSSNKSEQQHSAGKTEEDLTLEEVLGKYKEGPDTGVFTDGSARPNPGPGGWGFVHVQKGEIISQEHGNEEEKTTNNRMEMKALIEAFRYLQEKKLDAVVYSDSELCCNTLTKWAVSWEKNGWKRKTGPIKNLDLVKEAYTLFTSLPNVKIKWIEGHTGWRWNEYADSLATAWARESL